MDEPAQALTIAERTRADAVPIPRATRQVNAGPSVAMAGSGIVNLLTALRLLRSGYAVSLYDRSPDPRLGAHWTAYGCTRGGGDGRMFTLTEADSYNSRSWNADGTSNDLLNRPISEHGWLVSKPGSLSDTELRWAQDFHRLPPWLANSYNEDIFSVNTSAQQLWAGLRESDPGLFTESTGYRDGILRLYTETEYYRWHIARNERLGAINRILTTEQVCADYPALTPAGENGMIAGGIEVTGFTVNIHKFLARLIDMLEAEGAQLHWNTEISRIHWAEPDLADGMQTADGQLLRADHYVISPGAYGNDLLAGTDTHNRIHGMLGVWFTIPNIAPRLEHSVKIARKGHQAEETNVTLAVDQNGAPMLVCGSGYGWTGLNPHNIDSAELDPLFDALEDTLRRFFPLAHAAARAAGTLHDTRQWCVRPWTASSLGVFETVPAREGGAMVITGGHNTGGFTQSPVVAEAVLAAFENRPHPMHTRYHPLRLDSAMAGSSRLP